MRTPDEIHSMIDYLEQKDRAHPDIAVLRWVLKEDQRPAELAVVAERKQFDEVLAQQNATIKWQLAKIEDLQAKLSRFVQPSGRGRNPGLSDEGVNTIRG